MARQRNVHANPLPWQQPHGVTIKYVSEEGKNLRTLYPVAWPLPTYPFELLRAGITSGSVTLRFTVREDLSITGIQVIRATVSEFADSAKEAVSRWKFTRPPESKMKKWPVVAVECRFDFKVHEE